MLFLFYLLTVCLAVPIEKVNQVLDTKDAPGVGKELMTKLKSFQHDELSKVLITSLADADPDAVRHVKSLVEALIAAGEGERDTYTQDRDSKQTAFDTASGQLDADTTAHTTVAGQLSDARDEVTRLEGLKSDGQTAKEEAQEAFDDAVTSLGEAQGWLDDETTRVDSEKETLEEIRRLLNTLLPEEAEETPKEGKCVMQNTVKHHRWQNMAPGSDPVRTCKSHCDGYDKFGMACAGQGQGMYCTCLNDGEYGGIPSSNERPMYECLGECSPNDLVGCNHRSSDQSRVDTNCPGMNIEGTTYSSWNGFALGASWRTAYYSIDA
jgi:hypothetical protein